MSMGRGGIFGNPRVRRDPFGNVLPNYDDMGGMIPGMGDMQAMDGPQVAPKKGGFGFRDIVGIIGDGLAGITGAQPLYTLGKIEQRQLQARAEAEERAMMRKRAWELEDARMKGPELTPFQKSLAAAGIDPTSQQGLALARQYVEQQADPIIQTTQTTDAGTFLTGIPRSRLMGSGAPTAPVGRLTPIDGGQPMSAGPAAAAMSVAQFQALAQSMGPSAAAEYVRRNQIVVK